MPQELELRDYTFKSELRNDLTSQSSLLNEFEFTEALEFDQSFEGVPGGNIIFGGMQIRKKQYSDDTVGGWIGVDSDGKTKLYLGDASDNVKWDGDDLTVQGGTLTAGTFRTASSGERIQITSSTKKLELINSNGDVVGTLFYGTGTTDAILKLAPTTDARRALEFVIASGLGSDAKAITIDNNSASISIDITDGGLKALYIGQCDTNAIEVANAPTNSSALNFSFSSSDYPVIDMNQDGTATNSYGIRITQGTGALKEAIFIDDNANSHLSESIYIDRDGDTASDVHAMRIDSFNAGSGPGVGIDIRLVNHAFTFSTDNTDPTSGGGAATGRVPIRIAGATKYLAYY